MISNQEEQFSQKFSEQELQLSDDFESEEQFSHMISNQEEQLACRFSRRQRN
jgi:hypothetical protein